MADDILSGSELGRAILEWARLNLHQTPHQNTADGWRREFLMLCPADRRQFFPAQAQLFRSQLRQISPALRERGIEVAFSEGDTKTTIPGLGRVRAVTILPAARTLVAAPGADELVYAI